jgi:hypothetical protein
MQVASQTAISVCVAPMAVEVFAECTTAAVPQIRHATPLVSVVSLAPFHPYVVAVFRLLSITGVIFLAHFGMCVSVNWAVFVKRL